jgi:hypothetical protein
MKKYVLTSKDIDSAKRLSQSTTQPAILEFIAGWKTEPNENPIKQQQIAIGELAYKLSTK